MIDQDGVVCNRNYQTTKDIQTTLNATIEAGSVIVPNSDTPLERLVGNFRTLLGITCKTVIAEYGTVVSIDGETNLPLGIKGVIPFRNQLESIFSKHGWTVEVGDSATWVREHKRFGPNQPTVIFDGLRRQSVGLYLKQTLNDGSLASDATLWTQGLALLSETSLPDGLRAFDPNQKYDIAISNADRSDKTLGYRTLRTTYPSAQFFMIGDGTADVINDQSVTLCAVGNAVPELKDRATFISNHEFTAGLEDCLRWINRL
jgi:hypothetical protein